MPPTQTWPAFILDLQENILPLYLHHEQIFDPWSVHGRMHIGRAVLFAEFMLRHYQEHTDLRPDPNSVRYAIAFHDAGRQAGGPDFWEEDSAGLCTRFLQARGVENAEQIGALVSKHGAGGWPLDKRIVHDADVLEIMRPCCGHGGRYGFQERALRFLGQRDEPEVRDAQLRSALIEEAWTFIQVTENLKGELTHSTHYMEDLLEILASMLQACPRLNGALVG